MWTTSILKACGRSLRPCFERRFLSLWDATAVEIEYWDGRKVAAGRGSPSAVLEIACPSVVAEMVLSPSLGFGNAYADGRLRVRGDFEALLDVAFAADPARGPLRDSRVAHWLGQWPALVLPSRAVDNARHHYDRSNEFFGLWLDRTMTYSCAYFRGADDSLDVAQRQKLELVCRKLDLRPGQRLLDVGCGWGSLLFHAIERYGVDGVGVTPSLEQARYVESEARRRGLDGRLTLYVADWRSVGGTYDRVASVGMYEHVGKAAGRRFLRKWRGWLRPGGVSVLHTIGSMQSLPPDPWIRRNIFPGGYIPGLGEIVDHVAAAGLAVTDVENLWRHYAMTLAHWARNFQAVRETVERTAGERFARIWWLYLNGAKSAFRTGRCQLWQLVITADKSAPQPLTRERWLLPTGSLLHSKRCTQQTTTWKDSVMADHDATSSTEELNEHVFLLLKQVIQKSNDRTKDEVSRALLYFLVRVANTWYSIRTLRKHSPDENLFIVDAGVLLRAMFDAWFQAEYIVQDANSMNARASEYLEYEHVERYKISEKVLSHDNWLANKLKASAKRPEGEKRVQQEYDRVKDNYPVKKRQSDGPEKHDTKTRNTWYPGNLAMIAKSLGKQAEYDSFVTNFNGCVHSSALAVYAGPRVSPEYVLMLASKIAARVARLNVDHNRIDLGQFYGPIVDKLCKGLLNQ